MNDTTLLENAKMEKWFRQGVGNILMDAPYPTDSTGNELPHGAVLDFEAVPPKLHPRRALIWWLRLRHVNVPGNYPMHEFLSDCGSKEPGLLQLVRRVRRQRAPCMTVEEVREGMDEG